MRNRTKALVVLAASAALPSLSKAVIITYSFDPVDVSTSSSFGGTYSTLSSSSIFVNGAVETINVSSGTFIRVGVDGLLTAPTSGTGSGLTVNGSAANANAIGEMGFGINASTPSFAEIAPNASNFSNGAVAATTAISSSPFSVSKGKADGAGGIQTAAFITTQQSSGGPGSFTAGAGSPVEVAHNIVVDALGANGTQATFKLLPITSSTQYIAQVGTSTTKYQFDTLGAGDSTGTPGQLIINIGTPTAGGHPIISLVSGTTSPTPGYGNADGNINMSGGHSVYNVTTAANFTNPSTSGTVSVGGFTAGDTEIYALKLASNGSGGLTTTQIQTIVDDINGLHGNTAFSGITASAVTGSYAAEFPGYQVILTALPSLNTSGLNELGFDFSSSSEADTTVPNITVTGVAAVPEPATAAGVVLGAAGLLLGRRRKTIAIA